MNRGSTLIELIVYLGLFSIIIGGAVISVYGMAETSGSNETKIMLLEEGLFLQAKIKWVLSNLDTVNVPEKNSTCVAVCFLSIKKQNPDGGLVVLAHEESNLVISYNGGSKTILNSSSISISNVVITNTDEGDDKNSIVITFDLTAKNPRGSQIISSFSVIEYVY